MAKEYPQLVEIVAEFPKELVIARGYTGVSDLIGSVKCEFRVEFYDDAGIHIAGGIIPGIPLRMSEF